MFLSIAKALVVVAVAVFAIRHERSIRRQEKKGRMALHWTWEDEIWTRGINRRSSRDDAEFLPPEWDSTSCLERWGLSRFETEPDPGGYIIFIDGREQLGGNRYLFSDGLFIAKTLNRTLVEFPAANARIAGADADFGLGTYWDLDNLCRYHRILSLAAFRAMIQQELLDTREFLAMAPAAIEASAMSTLRTAKDVLAMFANYEHQKVIVMTTHWKSGIEREPLGLIQPRPYYREVAQRLINSQQGWRDGAYVAVQWRTETSTGNLTACYHQVREKVEIYRKKAGLGREQVFVNTDLTENASGTYANKNTLAKLEVLKAIQVDYPNAANNSVYAFLANVQDSGVQSITSGVVAASSRVLLASTRRDRSWAFNKNVCQKVHSNFIDLVLEWRTAMKTDDRHSTVSLFP